MTIDAIKDMSIKGFKWDALMAICFVFFLPFENSIFNVVACLYSLYLILVLLITRSFPYQPNVKAFRNTLFLPLLFLVLTISITYSQDFSQGVHVLVRSVPLLVTPLFFMLVRLGNHEKRAVLFTFVWANLLAFIINLFRSMWRSLHFTGGEFSFDATVFGNQDFWYSIVNGGNYFFIGEFSYFLHPTYWSVYLLFSIVILINFYPRSSGEYRKKVLSVVVIGLLTIAIFLCSSRIVMIGTAVVLLIYITIQFVNKRSFVPLVVGFVLMTVLGFAIINSPRVGGLSNLSNHIKYDLRVDGWIASMAVFKSSPLFGVGVGDAEKQLFDAYEDLGYTENLRLQLNEHNQFLQIANQTGVLGLGCFILAMAGGFAKGLRTNGFIEIAFIVIVFLVCLVECYIARQAGLIFYTFFYCFLFFEPVQLNHRMIQK